MATIVAQGIDLLVAATAEYAGSRAGDDAAHLPELGLFVRIRVVQTMAAGQVSMVVPGFLARAFGRR